MKLEVYLSNKSSTKFSLLT